MDGLVFAVAMIGLDVTTIGRMMSVDFFVVVEEVSP